MTSLRVLSHYISQHRRFKEAPPAMAWEGGRRAVWNMLMDRRKGSRLMNPPSLQRCWWYLAVLTLIAQMCVCAPTPAAGQPGSGPLADVIDGILADRVLAHGFQGVLVESLKDGQVLYERNSEKVFIPASGFKLLVSAAALDLLGPEYRMRTSLYVSGKRTSNGILKGDIILVGGGDPVFKHEHLQAMAAKIEALGIRVVEGDVVGDDTRFDDVRLGWGWAWDDESYYYAAQVSALNLNGNVVAVWVRPGKRAGDPASVRVTPATGYMTVRSDCRTSAPGSSKSVFVERIHGTNTIRVTGTVPLGYKPKSAEELIAVEDPTLFTCRTLVEMLQRDGVEVKGRPVRGRKPDDAELVAAHDSPPMSEILALMNKPSDNLIAECLLKTLGAQIKGQGTAVAGEEVELEFLKKIGADLTAVSITDGSGLSRVDYISPENLVAVLKYMHRHKHSKVFLDSLPTAGVDGTLRNRMRGTAAQGNARAKTGYVSRVSTISGYVTTKAGEPLVFSIMMNNHLCRNTEAKALQDKIIKALADLGDRQAASD